MKVSILGNGTICKSSEVTSYVHNSNCISADSMGFTARNGALLDLSPAQIQAYRLKSAALWRKVDKLPVR